LANVSVELHFIRILTLPRFTDELAVMVKLGLDKIIGQQYDVRSLVSLFIDLMLSIQS